MERSYLLVSVLTVELLFCAELGPFLHWFHAQVTNTYTCPIA